MGGLAIDCVTKGDVRFSVYINVHEWNWSFSSFSMMNCMLLWSPLKWFRNSAGFYLTMGPNDRSVVHISVCVPPVVLLSSQKLP
jgi:hypothetical protein